MTKVSLNQSLTNNIDFLKTSDTWKSLESFNDKIDIDFFKQDDLLKQIKEAEKIIYSSLCDDSWIGHCAKYHLKSGGKRFRAALALLSSKIFKLDKESSINVAVCCELIHNASLIHDDLQDRDLLRRGMPTVWSRFGDHSAINLGDYLISSSFEYLLKTKVKPEFKCTATEELSKIIKQAIKGQTTEILGRSDFHLKMEDYESTSRAKTGSLLCLPVKLVMLLKGIKNIKENYLKPIYDTGLAYQIQDDLSDFLGIKDRGLPGRDLKEGKMNVLIMHYIETATAGEKYLLQQFLKKRFDSVSEDEISHWIQQIRRTDAIGKSVKHLFLVIKKALKLSEKSDYKLNRIVKFIISCTLNRIFEKIKN